MTKETVRRSLVSRPTASRMNQVETEFGIMTRQRFTREWNASATPV